MKYEKLMKRFGAVAFALTVASSCIVGGTLAKYTTTVAGTGSAIVAKWAPSFKAGTNGGAFRDSINVKLTDTSLNSKVADDKIAPGTDGSFSVEVSRGANTEVGFTYSVSISDLNNRPANLMFYKDSGFTTPLTESGGVYALTSGDAHIMPTGTPDKDTLTVYWKWPYEVDTEASSAAESRDAADSEVGNKATASEAAATMTFKVNCTATQMNPTTP